MNDRFSDNLRVQRIAVEQQERKKNKTIDLSQAPDLPIKYGTLDDFMIPVTVNDKSFPGVLVDSGSPLDFIDLDTAIELKAELQALAKPSTLTFAKKGEVDLVTHKVTLKLEMNGYIEYRPFVVYPNLHDKILLGRPFIIDHHRRLGLIHPLMQLRPNQTVIENDTKYEDISLAELERECKKHNNVILTLLVQRIEYDEDAHPGIVPVDFDLKRFDDVVTDALPAGLPPDRKVKHRITLVQGSTPPHRPPYRLSHKDKQELSTQIETLLKDGRVIPYGSPYGAPVIFVHKKDGTKRLCVDYRALNLITIKERFPLPLIDDIFDTIQGAKVFSSLDLHSGYHQVAIAEEDYDKTAFVTPYGQYAWRVMPFGLTNAPATFQRLMNEIFHKILNKTVVVYLDDILVFSKTQKDHKRDLEEVFKILRANNLIAKRRKCYFFQTRLNFLGHMISSEGISPNEDKIKAIRTWPIPKSKKEALSFLGLTTYYRRFIEKYAHIAASLYDYTAEKTKWTEEQTRLFNELKDRLVSAPILILPDPKQKYVVYTDASDRCIGAVLQQTDKHHKLLGVVAYESKKLSGAQLNYPVREKECLAIHYALKKWQHYLSGTNFIVYSDHQSLNYIRTTPHQNPRILRWLEFFARFDFEIKYIPGPKNVVADALSRQPQTIHTVNRIGLLEEPDVLNLEVMKEEYINDHQFVDVYKILIEKQPIDPQLKIQNKLRKYTACDGLLRYAISTHDNPRLCVPIGVVRRLLLRQAHDADLNNHPGALKMCETLSRQYYWANMLKDCKAYARTCEVCQLTKTATQSPYGLIMPMPVPQQRWTEISMDYITGMEKLKNGNEKVLVVVDRLTKMVHLIPTPLELNTKALFNIFMKEVVRLHGIPEAITSDRDPTFTSHMWSVFSHFLGIDRRMSTVNHPQTDGQTERMNRVVEQQIRALRLTHSDLNWEELLPIAEFAINGSYQTTIGTTPFFANYGFHPRVHFKLPSDDDVSLDETITLNAKDVLRSHTTVLYQIRENMAQAQDSMERHENRHRRELILHPGELVAIKRKHLFRLDSQTKWLHPYVGPFTVERRINDNAYEIRLPPDMPTHPVINVENLKPFLERDHDVLHIPPYSPLDLDQRINDITEITKVDDLGIFIHVRWKHCDPVLTTKVHIAAYRKIAREKRCQLEQAYNHMKELDKQFHSELSWDTPPDRGPTPPPTTMPTRRLPSIHEPAIDRGRPRSRRGRMLGERIRSRARH